MIIGGNNDIYQVDQFVEGLNRAVHGLVSVTTDPEHEYSVCSGWLLTDLLVVVPDYIGASEYFCHPYRTTGQAASEPVPATMLSTIKTESKGSQPALLRLSRPLDNAALTLETAVPVPGDPIIVLQSIMAKYPSNFSLGTITQISKNWIKYNASTSEGSGGGPIISLKSWKIVGMHMLGLKEEKLNSGIRIDPILDSLRETSAWLEIVKFHNLAEAAYTALRDIPVLKPLRFIKKMQASSLESVATENYLTRAALSWSFDPEKVSEEEKKELQPLVVDVKATSWTLKSKERQRILKAAGSIIEMNDQLPDETTDATGQLVIKDILKGAPYNLDEIGEEQLSYWMQAVRWFDGVVPDLPTPAEVNNTLERKRTRSKLQNVIRGFRGRKKELDQLISWYNDKDAGPMLITGIGGMGKSALVGYFVNDIPADTLLLWLDFDRPDLAPDDAVSVLNAIAKQSAIQLKNFEAPDIDEENWKEGAKELGVRLAKGCKNTLSPIMILDGFEVAQHTKEYHEIWQVLEVILIEEPRLKVIVSGRAPVKSLKLLGKDATPLPLKGLIPEDAEKWLRDRGINDDEVLKIVLKLAEGIPLRLKLAVRLIDSGEKVKDLPDKLPQEYITGYLYQRILYRVIDPELIPVVEDLLVLRKCSKPMLVKILGDNVPQGLTAEKVYERLSREMALVGDAENLYGSFVVTGNSDKLELRPEVRSATLRLLEQNNKQKVQAMDEKAVDWYKDQDLTEPGNAAELVYHLLRLKKLDEARKIFRIECVPLLRDAINELPEDAHAEYGWLEKKVGVVTDEPTDNLLSWEIQTALEIKNRLGRGIVKDLDIIVNSRKQRTGASPLLVYDAFNCWQKGEVYDAINILKYADDATGNIQRDRLLVYAFLLAQSGDWISADEQLEKLEIGSFSVDWVDRNFFLTILDAARIRLTVDIDSELKLFELLQDTSGNPRAKDLNALSSLRQFLTPSDVVTPLLNDLFAKQTIFESSGVMVKVPLTSDELPEFKKKLQDERFKTAPFALSLEDEIQKDEISTWRKKFLPWKDEEFTDDLFNIGFNLAYRGYRRWKLATKTPVIGDIIKTLLEKREVATSMSAALRGVLPAFRGQPMRFADFWSIDELLVSIIDATGMSMVNEAIQNKLLYRYLLLAGIKMNEFSEKVAYQLPLKNEGGSKVNSMLVYLNAESPLELLCKNILGLPENYKFIP